MKSAAGLTIAALASQAAAFPAVMHGIAESAQSQPQPGLAKRVNGVAPGFNAKAQYISTSGQYTWQAPGPTDQRGPCPGLNAFANHNYIPHNGIATIQQFIDATTTVVGMGEDLAAFLAIYGAIFDGNLASWSIGGPDSRVGIPGLNQPQGISGSHNKYEADVSPTRGDLYQRGNDYELFLDQFKGQYAVQGSETEQTSNYDIGALTNWRVTRFQQSISENPYFFNNFFSGILVQPAAYTFQFRFMANHSAEYPEGRFSQQNLKDWFGVTGTTPSTFQHTPGHERIPNNWYRRAFGDEYTIPYFLQDLVGMAASNPQFLDFGGNTGTTNSFTPVDLENITGGLYNAQALMDPQKLACFEYELLTQQAPDLIEGYSLDAQAALGLLTRALGGLSQGLTCPKLEKGQAAQFNQAVKKYPGYTRLSKTGSYS